MEFKDAFGFELKKTNNSLPIERKIVQGRLIADAKVIAEKESRIKEIRGKYEPSEFPEGYSMESATRDLNELATLDAEVVELTDAWFQRYSAAEQALGNGLNLSGNIEDYKKANVQAAGASR